MRQDLPTPPPPTTTSLYSLVNCGDNKLARDRDTKSCRAIDLLAATGRDAPWRPSLRLAERDERSGNNRTTGREKTRRGDSAIMESLGDAATRYELGCCQDEVERGSRRFEARQGFQKQRESRRGEERRDGFPGGGDRSAMEFLGAGAT